MTREIPLTLNRIALVDDTDYPLLIEFTWHFDGVYASRMDYSNPPKRRLRMHRVIMDAPTAMDVDHINHDKLDNQRDNLRLASRSENLSNRLKHHGTSRYKGVFRPSRLISGIRPWAAQIKSKSISEHLGYYATEEDAALAYNEAAVRIFGEFALLNIITPVPLTAR